MIRIMVRRWSLKYYGTLLKSFYLVPKGGNMAHIRLLTNRGPDPLGSGLILIWRLPDQSGSRLISLWWLSD